VYDGDWKDDKRNCNGKHTYHDGVVYEGNWKDDKRNGKGKYTYSNGKIDEGDWKDDQMNDLPCFYYCCCITNLCRFHRK